MLPFNSNLNPLPLDPSTVMRGFCSVENHPDRQHEHKKYRINNLASLGKIIATEEKYMKNSVSGTIWKASGVTTNFNVVLNSVSLPDD